MNKYKITDPQTGKVIHITGAKPPSQDELDALFSATREQQQKKQSNDGFSFGGGMPSGGAGESFPLTEPLRQPINSGNPKIDEFLKKVQGVAGQAGAGALNGISGGVAEALMRKGGQTLGQPQTTAEKIARYGTEIPATAAGIVGQSALKAVSGIPKAGMALKGLVGGMAAGAVYTPETPTGDLVQASTRLKNSLFSGLTGGAIGATTSGTIRSTKSLVNLASQNKFATKIITQLQSAKTAASDKFGARVNALMGAKPNAEVNLEDAFIEAQKNLNESPSLRVALNRHPILKTSVDAPETFKNVNLLEAQNLKNKLTSFISESKLSGNNIKPTDLPLIDLVDNITEAQLKAFPEFANDLKAYGTIKNNYNLASKAVKTGNIIGTKSYDNPLVKQAMKEILPEPMMQQIGDARTAAKFLKAAWKIGKWYGIYRVLKGSVGFAGNEQ